MVKKIGMVWRLAFVGTDSGTGRRQSRLFIIKGFLYTGFMYNPFSIECKESCFLKERYMPMKEKRNVSYEYEGYQVCVHFHGDKTLVQCLKNLAERRTEQRQCSMKDGVK